MYIVKSVYKKGKYFYFKTDSLPKAVIKFNQCAQHNHVAEIYDTKEDEILDSTEWMRQDNERKSN